MAQAYLWEGRIEKAASLALQALALNPRSMTAYRVLPPCYAIFGRYNEARRSIGILRARNPEINQGWFSRSNPALAWSPIRDRFMMRVGERLVALGMPR